jgi:hypothetical protein
MSVSLSLYRSSLLPEHCLVSRAAKGEKLENCNESLFGRCRRCGSIRSGSLAAHYGSRKLGTSKIKVVKAIILVGN